MGGGWKPGGQKSQIPGKAESRAPSDGCGARTPAGCRPAWSGCTSLPGVPTRYTEMKERGVTCVFSTDCPLFFHHRASAHHLMLLHLPIMDAVRLFFLHHLNSS